jgi:hypothetical protein
MLSAAKIRCWPGVAAVLSAISRHSAEPAHRRAGLALLRLAAAAELGHQTLYGLSRLRDQHYGGVVGGDRHGGEHVEAAEDGAGIAEQHRRLFRLGAGGRGTHLVHTS